MSAHLASPKAAYYWLLFIVLTTFFPFVVNAQCSGFQLAFGGQRAERAYDIAATGNNVFYVAGVTESFGNAKEIIVSKHKADGALLWSKTYGFSRDETIRKIAATVDGGLLVVGQTNSFQNRAGDILCFKIDAVGKLVWNRQWGMGSAYGDLGMDIIETSDGGAALTGILNVNGEVADMVVIKLNRTADVVWSKRFDRGDGEDGVGIVQKGDTLIVASDLQNSSAHYEMQVMKLKMSDGDFIEAKKLSPDSRGLFNPYLFKNPFSPGYFISGHTIDFNTYANMKHTIIALDENFNITNSTTINVNPVTNDFYTGFLPMSDGSFITTTAAQMNADGYVIRIDKNNKVQYAQKLNKPADLRLYRLIALQDQVVAVGSVVRSGQEDMFLTGFSLDGMPDSFCDAEKVQVTIDKPLFHVSDFAWPTIKNITMSAPAQALSVNEVSLQKNDLCPKTPCDSIRISGPEKVCNKAEIVKYDVYRAANCTAPFKVVADDAFGDIVDQTNTSISIRFKREGRTAIKVEYENACKIVSAQINVHIQFSPQEVQLGSDVTTCVDTSFVLDAGSGFTSYLWQDGKTQAQYNVQVPGIYHVSAINMCGIVFRDSVTYERKIPQPFTASANTATICKGDTVQLNASGGQLYAWQSDAILNNSNSATVMAAVLSSQNVSVQIRDIVCNRDTLIVVPLIARELPSVKIEKSNDVTCSVDTALLTAKGAITYTWQQSEYITNRTSNSITVKPIESSLFRIEGKDAVGCIGRDSILVNFYKTGSQNLHVPTAFTPNGDGLNDLYRPILKGAAKQYEFLVFNRWGELIYKTNKVMQGWNGARNNVPQPGGVYVYYIIAEGNCNEAFERKGTFLLIR